MLSAYNNVSLLFILMWGNREMFGTGGEENVTHKDLVLVFDRVLEDVKRESGALFSAKVVLVPLTAPRYSPRFQIIYSTLRLITTEELEWYLEDCLALKKEFPHLIAGMSAYPSLSKGIC